MCNAMTSNKTGTRNSAGFRVPAFSLYSCGLEDDLIDAFGVAYGFEVRGVVGADVNRRDSRFKDRDLPLGQFDEHAHFIFIALALNLSEQRHQVARESAQTALRIINRDGRQGVEYRPRKEVAASAAEGNALSELATADDEGGRMFFGDCCHLSDIVNSVLSVRVDRDDGAGCPDVVTNPAESCFDRHAFAEVLLVAQNDIRFFCRVK